MVETAVANVIGPAVAADDPHALPDQVVGEVIEFAGGGVRGEVGQLGAQFDHVGALGCDAGLRGLVGVEQGFHQRGTHRRRKLLEQAARQSFLEVQAQPNAEAKLGVVLEQ